MDKVKLISNSIIWKDLYQHYQKIAGVQMRNLFAQDKDRFDTFSVTFDNLLLDYSKNLINIETMKLLNGLIKAVNLMDHIDCMFNGKKINVTEQRAVLHTALRNPDSTPEIHSTLIRMFECADKIRNGKWQGYTGKAITDVVNIGIGGSDLGPAMVIEALTPYTLRKIKYHFVSNVDGTHISETLKYLNPETTLFIVASKTFTTQETLCNAKTAKNWLKQGAVSSKLLGRQLLAVTAKPERAIEFGIDEDNIFPFWDWVGGRYSLWSAIGLSIVIAIGSNHFRELLAGAHDMDEHFRNTPFDINMPVILALIGIWNINFLGAKTQAILPYDQYLCLLPSYLQQLEMESNGKRVTFDGDLVDYATAPVIWGAVGTNGQHAFHQLLMQGTQIVPVDFILPVRSHNEVGEHHILLFANCLAQSQALMQGRTKDQVLQELMADGMNEVEAKKLIPHKIVPGNNPSNTILIDKITPKTLGSLLALYEHKVFVQGVIWGINSFDQWGVELGKKLTNGIISILEKNCKSDSLDSSTGGLVKCYLGLH